jgi:hypothetical protein
VGQRSTPATKTFGAIGIAERGIELDAFVPFPPSAFTTTSPGLHGLRVVAVPGGSAVRAFSSGGVWALGVFPT